MINKMIQNKARLYLILLIFVSITIICLNTNFRLKILDLFKNRTGLNESRYINNNNSVCRIIVLYSDSTFTRKDNYYFFSDFYSGKYFLKGNKIGFHYNLEHAPDSELELGMLNDNSLNISFLMSYGDNDYTVRRDQVDYSVDTSIFNKVDTIPLTFILQP